MKRVLTEPQGRLLRALIRLVSPPARSYDRQFPAVIVESFETDEWASLTFAGHRHRIALVVSGSTPSASLDGLDVVGAIVAEAEMTSVTPVAAGFAVSIAVTTVNETI